VKIDLNRVTPWLCGSLVLGGCLIGAGRAGYLVDLQFSPALTRFYVAPAPVPAVAPTPVPVPSPAVSPEPVAVSSEPETIPDYQSSDVFFQALWSAFKWLFPICMGLAWVPVLLGGIEKIIRRISVE
jgi:hypothetical protein